MIRGGFDTFCNMENSIDIILNSITNFRDSFFDGKYFDVERIKEILSELDYTETTIPSSEIKFNYIDGYFPKILFPPNPVIFRIGVVKQFNFSKKNKQISIGYSDRVLKIITKFQKEKVSLSEVCNSLEIWEKEKYKREWSKHILKSKILHIITRWLRSDPKYDDSFLCEYDYGKIVFEKDDQRRFYKTDSAQIQIYINEIREIKQSYSKEYWDKLTLDDILCKTTVFLDDIWRKTLYNWDNETYKLLSLEMLREDLFGKRSLEMRVMKNRNLELEVPNSQVNLVYQKVLDFQNSFFDGDSFDVEKVYWLLQNHLLSNSEIDYQKFNFTSLYKKTPKFNIGVIDSNSYNKHNNIISVGFTENLLAPITLSTSEFITLEEVCLFLPEEERNRYKREWNEILRKGVIRYLLSNWQQKDITRYYDNPPTIISKEYLYNRHYHRKKIETLEENSYDNDFFKKVLQLRGGFTEKSWKKVTFLKLSKKFPYIGKRLRELQAVGVEELWFKKFFKYLEDNDILGRIKETFHSF